MGKKTVPPLRDKEEARKRGRNGGLASGKARQKRKELRELLEVALSMPDEESGQTNAEAIAAALVVKAKAGDVRAFEVIRDTVGEKPVNLLDHRSTDESMRPVVKVDLSRFSPGEVSALVDAAYGSGLPN
ncbi:hypothetical protein [Desulfovibrio sp. ZJ369]|uniref:hypothetical protein n=1 Tax=Desulfovibrio sp. ZJ369 TaxID=2709793 RepID=UPI0013ED64CC|nr:hypothetical protein [Desulfovibrio sp. ZJ369]